MCLWVLKVEICYGNVIVPLRGFPEKKKIEEKGSPPSGQNVG